MPKYFYILITLLLTLISCKKDVQEKQVDKKASNPVKDTVNYQTDKNVVIAHLNSWNDAHNRLDTQALHQLYGNYIYYYGEEVILKDLLIDKAKSFAKYPDFKQKIIGAISIVQPIDDKFTSICRFNKQVTAGGKTEIYPAYIEIYTNLQDGLGIKTEGDSITDILLLKRKHLYSQKVSVKNGNIFLNQSPQKKQQITYVGKDTNAVLSNEGKRVVFVREEHEDGRSLRVYDIASKKDSVVWEDFWLNIVYFDSLCESRVEKDVNAQSSSNSAKNMQ